MKLRNNHNGNTSFRSFIPPLMEDYSISESPALTKAIKETEDSFDELNNRLLDSNETILRKLMEDEARTSYQLSEVRPKPCFALAFTTGLNPNEENILKATDYGVETLTELPIGTRLIKNLHYLVCGSSDYDKKYRGEIRKSPVWIGMPGSSIENAEFIPPVDSDLAYALSNLDNFINCSDLNVFVKAAMIHYQFEMLHPFIDANGRVGRILNTLFLYENKQIRQPVLLLSEALSQDYKAYTDNIQLTNESGDMERWLLYFLPQLSNAARLTSSRLKAYTESNCK